ncbi:hypothetical protein XBO1_480002 [Xenorhabdus bovienii str. oregonense]|uniref:Uncharacterized protein n=1 Tax=Xenorhabdus bovienii str. oregonense TaxID=1398202 RepID=A0A077NZG8_XENBV|nr:hypothetical protein XBO1_480002 [Xenorhabdus bovienii str. oregonense]
MSLVRVQLEEPNLRNPDLVLLIGISAFDFINQLSSLLRCTFNLHEKWEDYRNKEVIRD